MAMSLVRTTEPATQQPTDEALARRLRDGDVRAGEVLAKRYAQPLVRYLHRLVRSDQLAEELHQQTWLSVLEHLDRFDANMSSTGGGAGGFKAWLFRIATNKANDLWRSKGREKNVKEGLKRVIEEAVPDAADIPQTAEQVDKLRWAIDQLPEPQRQVLLLRYYSEMKFVEIADMLGCPLNTALGRMHKAMTRLKELLEAPRPT